MDVDRAIHLPPNTNEHWQTPGKQNCPTEETQGAKQGDCVASPGCYTLPHSPTMLIVLPWLHEAVSIKVTVQVSFTDLHNTS